MNITFATYATSQSDLLCNYLLASSIHDFSGNMSDMPLRIYVSSKVDMQNMAERFAGLNVIFSTYPAARKDIRYAFKSAAACACEADVKEGNVIWLDRHMIVLGPCVNLLLNPSEQFAYRPPHLKLLGASADEPLSKMWEILYSIAEIDDFVLFPIYTEVDSQKIWPYFSAGHFSFRAEAGIMHKWDALFNMLVDHPKVKPLLDKSITEDGEYIRVYLHQIALTLAVLKNQSKDTIKPLPLFYGYPTHLHKDIETYYQASEIDQLHTAFYNCHDSAKPRMPVSKQMRAWLKDKISTFES